MLFSGVRLRRSIRANLPNTRRLLDEAIHDGELAGPVDVVQKLAQIKPVVIGRVSFGVVGRGDGAHFVSVHGVIVKEALHLFCHQSRGQMVPENTQFSVPGKNRHSGLANKTKPKEHH